MTDNSINTIDLNGSWLIRADPRNAGLAARWWTDDRKPADWRTARVPAAWQTVFGSCDPAIAWYSRSIELPPSWLSPGQRAWLCFESVATSIRVWINGVEVGEHTGDWVPFQIDITDAIVGAVSIELSARVDKIKAPPPVWIDGAPVSGGHITKGFHDVLSIQHGGIWGGVRLERSGGIRAHPDGVCVMADLGTGRVRVSAELAACDAPATLEVEVRDPEGASAGRSTCQILPGSAEAELSFDIKDPVPWSPQSPRLYTATVSLSDPSGAHAQHIPFGFRSVTTGGPENHHLLLNGRPIFLRAVLDWGHEPEHIAPAPTRDEVRGRFGALRELGFNCVCICMWYPPPWFYDIADETGMLIWQEHPVWKSPMSDDLIPEYQRQFTSFFRRDANHPSVILVSGSCEHEGFNPKLAEWWWSQARRRLPDRALQIQTAFFAWTDPAKTDLHDEHTYESSGQWVRYLDDLQAALKRRGPKPFIMGESVLYTSWPDIGALLDPTRTRQGEAAPSDLRPEDNLPWSHPRGLLALADVERGMTDRYGADITARFKRDAHHYHIRGRKFQMERFRAYPNHAGLVMNHLRDVMACRCGFMDDLGSWRFKPDDLRGWMNEAPVLLWTPDHRRAYFGGQAIPCRVAVANFSDARIRTRVSLRIDAGGSMHQVVSVPIDCVPGEVASNPIQIVLPRVAEPTRFTVTATTTDGSLVENNWDLWVLPRTPPGPDGVLRLTGIDFVHARDAYPDFEEHAYSGGWGLKIDNPVCILPDPAVLRPDLPPHPFDVPIPPATRVVLTHRLTENLIDFAAAGGCILHLASKGPGSMPTRYVSMWGQTPLIRIDQATGAGHTVHDCALDLLDYDLTRRFTRAIPVGELNIADSLCPLIRLVYTHDMTTRPKLLDAVAAARVGKGSIIVSTLDHSEDGGQWLLEHLIKFAAGAPTLDVSLDPAVLRRWTVEQAQC